MRDPQDAIITKTSDNRKEFTRVTFTLDLKRFQIEKFYNDLVALFKRRAYDVAISTDCKITLSGKQDSAKALAVDGLDVIGHDHYGVYPLKDKIEVAQLIKIFDLNYGEKYANRNGLSKSHYEKLMILADPDRDGLAKSTAKQGKEYFSNIDRYRIIFKYDLIKDDVAIQLAFNSSLSEDRKDLIKWHTEDIKQQREQNLPIDYLYKKKIQNKLI
ncbi:unnamed protein product [Rotaria sp. Silwood1]|nr:unnamed protein product [Rotaria sp. Silwood1]CAF1672815.1 unnamed protein product [Rotaria sp. Silwood1]